MTADDPGGRPCQRPERLGRLIVDFNAALNAADTDALRRFWQERRKELTNDRGPHARGTFKWFSITRAPSTGRYRHFVAFSPGKAIRYLREQGGLRMQLTETNRGAYQGVWHNEDGSVFHVVGKADFNCNNDLIGVWSMAVRGPDDDPGWDSCPDPPGGRPSDALIACDER